MTREELDQLKKGDQVTIGVPRCTWTTRWERFFPASVLRRGQTFILFKDDRSGQEFRTNRNGRPTKYQRDFQICSDAQVAQYLSDEDLYQRKDVFMEKISEVQTLLSMSSRSSCDVMTDRLKQAKVLLSELEVPT